MQRKAGNQCKPIKNKHFWKYIMKKLITFAVCTALSTSTFANIFSDIDQVNNKVTDFASTISQSNDKETTLSGTFKTESGLFIGAETSYDWNKATKGRQETSLGMAYRFNLTDNFYLMPQVIYSKQHKNSSYNEWDNDEDVSNYQDETIEVDFIAESTKIGDSWELGLQTGYHFDNGLFIAARYGYETSQNMMRLEGYHQMPGGQLLLKRRQLDDKVASHNTDLTVGYQMGEMALVTASWLHTRTADDISFSMSGENIIIDKEKLVKVKGSSNDFEVKAAFTGMKYIRPFISYTVVGDYKLKGEHKELDSLIGKDKNRIEAGITIRF